MNQFARFIIKNNVIVLCTLYFILVFASCKKDKEVYTVEPIIEFKGVAPQQVVQYQDKIIFSISYKDGDGDLGENNANVKNLFLKDNRNNVTYQFRVKQLAPDGASIAIQGVLNVELANTSITDGSSSQTATFSIYVVDRAGHGSNTITTSSITIIN